MYDNLQHEQSEIQDIQNYYEAFKYPPQQTRQNNQIAINPRLGNLNPNFAKNDKENVSEKYIENWAQNDDQINTSPRPVNKSHNPHKLMSKEEKLALRKNVNNHYNQFIGDMGNPLALGSKNIN